MRRLFIIYLVMLLTQEKEEFYYNFNHYNVLITYKRMRNIRYRYDPDTLTFKISAPYRASKRRIYKYLEKFAPSLIKRMSNKRKPIIDNSVFVFGTLLPIEIGNENKIYQDKVIIKKKEDLNKLLKKELKNYLLDKVPYYEKIMNTSNYKKISVRNSKTRFGSNSKEYKSLSFSSMLAHFSFHLIDSVIMHELTHDKHFDHSVNFYNFLKSFSPDYKECKKALDSTNYSYGKDIIS